MVNSICGDTKHSVYLTNMKAQVKYESLWNIIL